MIGIGPSARLPCRRRHTPGHLAVVVVVAVVVVAARAFGGGSSWNGPRRGTALQILEDRFARGEIDAAEFEEKRRVLSG